MDFANSSRYDSLEDMSKIKKILVVGNAAGGKTRLSRRLAEIYKLPVTHVDSIQFLPGMKIRPLDETRKALSETTSQSEWIIDGHGPLDQIEKRFLVADRIVFVDLSLFTHYWWLAKRQIKSLWSQRPELAKGCNEATLAHTLKVIQTMKSMHRQMRPELLRIFDRENLRGKVIRIKNRKEWQQVFEKGLPK